MRERADQELVQAVQAGDTSAYGELFERYQSRIYNFAYGILGNPDDARDATQDAFVRVFEALPRKAGQDLEFSAYLYRAARNLSYDVAKSRGRCTTPEALDEVPEVGMYADPVRSTLFTEQQEVVRDAVATLPEEYRAVLMLREVQELSYQQIADAMGMSRTNVGVTIMRARLKFKGAFRMSHVDVEKLASECQTMLPKLSAYIDDELKPADRVKVDAHLDECPLCRLALDEMREASKSYRGFIPLLPPLGMGAEVLSRVTPGTPGFDTSVPRMPGGESDAGSGGADGAGASGAGSGSGGRALSSLTASAKVSLAVAGVAVLTTLALGGLALGGVLPGFGSSSGLLPVQAGVGFEPGVHVPVLDRQAPGVLRGLSPADGARVESPVVVSWSKATDPSGVTYEIEVELAMGSGAGWQHVDGGSGLVETLFETEASGMARRWRVRAVDGAGNAGVWTLWRTFTLDEGDTGTAPNDGGVTDEVIPRGTPVYPQSPYTPPIIQ